MAHQLQDLSEFREINSLLRFQRMLLEEWNDPFVQMVQASHPIRHSAAVVRSNHAAPKKLLECVQKLDVSLVLYNCEFREHLKTGSHLRVWIDANEEATFAVNKADHPLRFQPPRLWLNVKSLRVLHVWSLPCGLSPCPPDFDYRHLRQLVPDSCMRSFPHIVQFY